MGTSSSEGRQLQIWQYAITSWAEQGEGATSSITGGGAIRALEYEFGRRLGGRPVLAVGSGTAALAACLIGVGVRPGSEVITSVLDWPAAAEAIRWIGAIPVLADVDPATGTLAPNELAGLLSPQTAAVVATHLYGVPADIPALRAALPRDLPIVEDAAQALGATLDGHPVGTLGDAAAFSLGPGKHVDAGEGGLAAFADEAAWDLAVCTTQHRVRTLATEQPETATRISSRIHPMAAIIALHLLPHADDALSDRRAAVESWITRHPGATLVGHDHRRRSAMWQIPVTGAPHEATTTMNLALPTGADPGGYPGASAFMATSRLLHR